MARPPKSRPAARGPKAFDPNDPTLTLEPAEPLDLPPADASVPVPAPKVPDFADMKRGIRWGSLLFGAVGSLIALAAGVWLTDLAFSLLAREDWLGWLALGLLAIAGLAAAMIVLRELWGLARLARLGRVHRDADAALKHDDKDHARSAVRGLKRLTGARADMAWRLARFAEHEGDIMDARELLTLAERELVAPLDTPARAIVAASARRVSVLTAVSPVALIDMTFVAIENLRMLRRLATLYGARPGTLGLFKLARMVVTHILLTGGIAIGDDLVHQVIGHGLTARLSARLGQGVFNGALTTRVGIAAIDVCRPLPWIEATRPRFRDLAARVLRPLVKATD